MSQLFHILTNGGIVLGVFVILLLNTKGVRKTRANTFLSILLGALTFSTFHLRYAGDVINHFSLRTHSLGAPTFLVIAPLLWFYIVELTDGRVRFSITSLLHFIVAEGLMVGVFSIVVAVIVSIALSYFMGRFIGHISFRTTLTLKISLSAIAIWVLIVVLGSYLATILPARRANSVTTREALAYE